MAKYRIREPDNFDKYEELVFIVLNLQYWTKRWKVEYGNTKVSKELYERKLSEWLANNTEPLGENELNVADKVDDKKKRPKNISKALFHN